LNDRYCWIGDADQCFGDFWLIDQVWFANTKFRKFFWREIMSKELKVFLTFVLVSFLTVAGCSQESRDAVGDAAEDVTDSVANAADVVGDAAGEAVDVTVDAAEEMADDAIDAAVEMADGAADAIDSLVNDVDDAK
jgi:hypothetical protein